MTVKLTIPITPEFHYPNRHRISPDFLKSTLMAVPRRVDHLHNRNLPLWNTTHLRLLMRRYSRLINLSHRHPLAPERRVRPKGDISCKVGRRRRISKKRVPESMYAKSVRKSSRDEVTLVDICGYIQVNGHSYVLNLVAARHSSR